MHYVDYEIERSLPVSALFLGSHLCFISLYPSKQCLIYLDSKDFHRPLVSTYVPRWHIYPRTSISLPSSISFPGASMLPSGPCICGTAVFPSCFPFPSVSPSVISDPHYCPLRASVHNPFSLILFLYLPTPQLFFPSH